MATQERKPSAVVADARKVLSQSLFITGDIVDQIVPGDRPVEERADYWFGILQGTISALLAIVPEE